MVQIAPQSVNDVFVVLSKRWPRNIVFSNWNIFMIIVIISTHIFIDEGAYYAQMYVVNATYRKKNKWFGNAAPSTKHHIPLKCEWLASHTEAHIPVKSTRTPQIYFSYVKTKHQHVCEIFNRQLTLYNNLQHRYICAWSTYSFK